MRYVIPALFAFLAALSAQSAEEIVPGLLLADQVEIDGRLIRLDMEWDDAVAILGKARLDKRPKKYTASKLLAEHRMVEQLVPWEPRMLEISRGLAPACGPECWTRLAQKDLGDGLQLRAFFIGRNPETLRAYLIVLDRNRSAMAAWRQQFIADQVEQARYFMTPNGTLRISRLGNIVRVERVAHQP